MPTKTKPEYMGTHGLTDHMAEALAEEIEEVGREVGSTDAPAILEWARSNPKSDWHHQLQWDDMRLGDLHRCAQIRRIVGYIRLKPAKPKARAARCFVSLPRAKADTDEPIRQYVPRAQVVSHEEKQRRYVTQTIGRIVAECEELQDMADSFTWLQDFLRKVAAVGKKLKE